MLSPLGWSIVTVLLLGLAAWWARRRRPPPEAADFVERVFSA
jgi:MYXO-CTERM domain-containing protein